ncbi:MAG TPA: hypothetical protein ACFYEC_02820 [Candidatus Brocadiaceae bacterium]
MSTILKENILYGKARETTSKEKVDKIMGTIFETPKTPSNTKTEIVKDKTPPKTISPVESFVKQYLFSSETLIEGENKADLDELRNKVEKELKPSGEMESIIVDRIVSSIWRLKRCLKIESQIMEYETSCVQEYEQGFFRTRKRTNKELLQLKALKITDDKNRVVELSKYEARLEKQIYRAMGELEKRRRLNSRREKRTMRKDN